MAFPPFARATAALLRAGRAIPPGLWLTSGVALILFLGLEGLYRAQAAIRASEPESARTVVDSALHPDAHEAWWGPFQGSDGLGAWYNRYHPYRSF